MLMSDMLDVIYCMFEDDMVPSWEHDVDVKSRVRAMLYQSLYKREYKYSVETTESGPHTQDIGEWNLDSEPTGMVKPFIPETSPDDFMEFLDGPLN